MEQTTLNANLHSRKSIIFAHMDACKRAIMALYQYFKPVTKSLPDLEGSLFKTLPLATIKVAGHFKTTKGSPQHNKL